MRITFVAQTGFTECIAFGSKAYLKQRETYRTHFSRTSCGYGTWASFKACSDATGRAAALFGRITHWCAGAFKLTHPCNNVTYSFSDSAVINGPYDTGDILNTMALTALRFFSLVRVFLLHVIWPVSMLPSAQINMRGYSRSVGRRNIPVGDHSAPSRRAATIKVQCLGRRRCGIFWRWP